MELYLRECLDSIKDQTFKDWECIIVDDGSTDRSPEICDEYQDMDSRFKVIHKENGGLSNARNSALKIVSGDTIGFVDSDDYIEPDMFEYLYRLLIDYDADIAQIGYWEDYKDKKKSKKLTEEISVLENKNLVLKLFTGELPDYVWNKLHKRHVITTEFPEGRNFEDIAVYGEWMKNVKKMIISPALGYHYRMRKGSIVHNNNVNNMSDYFKSCIERVNMMESLFGENCYSEIRSRYVYDMALSSGKVIARAKKDIKRRNEIIKYISSKVNNYSLPSLSVIGLRDWFRSLLLKNNPLLFIRWMNFTYLFNTEKISHPDNNLYD